MLKYFLPVLVGLGMLTLNPAVDAKGGGGGHGGGGHGGGGHGGGGHGGGRGGGHGGGNFHHGGNFNRGAFFYGGFYPGYYSPWGYGYGAGYYNPGDGYYNGGYNGGYYNGGYYAAPSYLSPGYANPVAPLSQEQALNNSAQIDVVLPRPDAKVWVDNNAMSATGTQRSFVSPALEAGYSYTYRVTAAWMENGKEVRLQRTVPVAPGRVSLADFTRANPPQKMPVAQD